MQNVVKVTRRGHTTIPAEFRQKLGIKEGKRALSNYLQGRESFVRQIETSTKRKKG